MSPVVAEESGAVAKPSNPASHRAQAERCRRLAISVMDRVIQERLLDAARIYDELAAQEEAKEAQAGDRSASGQ